jgi:hypothetical protein
MHEALSSIPGTVNKTKQKVETTTKIIIYLHAAG